MKALVLAAGLGERARPLTLTTPKPMLEVGGRPLIHYPLAMLRHADITQVAINVHHLAEVIQRGLGDGSGLGMEITYSPEPTLTGTGGPLNALRGFFGNDTFALANSDSILDLDLAAMIAFHRDRGAIATIGLYKPTDGRDYEHIEVDADGRICRMSLIKSRHPLAYTDYAPSGIETAELEWYMYPGIMLMEPEIFDLIPPTTPWALFARLYGPMVANRQPVFGFVHRGLFRTVDDLRAYESLRDEFATSPPKFEHLVLPAI